MAATTLVALAAFLFKNSNFLILFVFEYGGFNARTFDERSAKASVCTFSEHQNFLNADGVAGFGFWVGVNLKDVALAYSELSPLCSDCRFHGKSVVAKHSPG